MEGEGDTPLELQMQSVARSALHKKARAWIGIVAMVALLLCK